MISLPRGTGLRAYLEDACQGLGFQPRIAFEVSDPRIVAQLAGRGLGVALLPESVTRSHPAKLRAIPLAHPELRGRIALAWRAHQPASPAARAFIKHARRRLTRPRGPAAQDTAGRRPESDPVVASRLARRPAWPRAAPSSASW